MMSRFLKLVAMLPWLLVLPQPALMVEENELDPNGYILYCPCMGRFGNQADHFLGALSFAHGLNKTLVLPPWVEYHRGKMESVQVPFSSYFQVAPLREYHRVMTMEYFMTELAPTVWPVGKRTAYCYSARHGNKEKMCNAKEGNPFGPFWNTFNVDFDASEFYGPFHYDTHDQKNKARWLEKYPPSDHYVLSFTGAPASFPVREVDLDLHRYLQWSDAVNAKVDAFIKENGLDAGPWLGIHLRNGVDWDRACEHVSADRGRNLFASAQCLGFRQEHGTINRDLCLPPRDTVLKQVKSAVKRIKAGAVFVATDNDPMTEEIKKLFKNKVKVVSHSPPNPHVDLALLARAELYIGNCVSTFSAFAVRERRANGKPVQFWAFNLGHDEL